MTHAGLGEQPVPWAARLQHLSSFIVACLRDHQKSLAMFSLHSVKSSKTKRLLC